MELTGSLTTQTFPGPPGYESIKSGDEPERGFYLKLDSPIDLMPNVSNHDVENAQSEKAVQIMQLAIDAEDDKLWRRFRGIGAGQHVKIAGTLFHRFTGHHHSRVLLDVAHMELLAR